MKNIFSAFIALTAISVSGAGSGSVVTATGGQVRGAMLNNGGSVFIGIPFARSPVSDQGWCEPMLAELWQGVRDATAFGAICARYPDLVPKAAEISTKDCLFLNVCMPQWPSQSSKPMIVWIPGSGELRGQPF